MKSFWQGLKLGIRALVTKPLQYLTNPIGTTTEMYREDLQAQGVSMAEVDQAVKAYEDSGGILFSLYKTGSDLASGIKKTLSFIGSNLTVILIIALAIIAAWYFLMARKAIT